jgi:hypothetical protein
VIGIRAYTHSHADGQDVNRPCPRPTDAKGEGRAHAPPSMCCQKGFVVGVGRNTGRGIQVESIGEWLLGLCNSGSRVAFMFVGGGECLLGCSTLSGRPIA